jgi:hypothetical protein
MAFDSGAGHCAVCLGFVRAAPLNARTFRSVAAMRPSATQRAEENVDQHELGARLTKESNVTQQQ